MYLTIQETAALLRLGERAVYDMLRTGRIPGAAKAAGKWRVDEEKLIEWMAAGGELRHAATEPTNEKGNDPNV